MHTFWRAILVAVALMQFQGCRVNNGAGVYGELGGMSAALENYKADHGNYPTDPATSEVLRPNTSFDPASYIPSSQFLYRVLSGDSDGNPTTSGPGDAKPYFEFRRDMLRSDPSGADTYIIDRWNNSFGYSTLKATHPTSSDGNNPTFDLWSTGGGKTQKERRRWTTNWEEPDKR